MCTTTTTTMAALAQAGVAALLLLLCSVALPSLAQNSPADYLAAHNAARASVAVGPLAWDAGVEAYARSYAEARRPDCRLSHSGGPYGENIFWGSGADFAAADAVGAWVAEAPDYDCAGNSCRAGRVCGHYTQVVWSASARLGCARVVCDGGRGVFIVCDYSPPGNIVGERSYNCSGFYSEM